MIEGPRKALTSEPEASEKAVKKTTSILSAAVRADGSHQRLTDACTLKYGSATVR